MKVIAAIQVNYFFQVLPLEGIVQGDEQPVGREWFLDKIKSASLHDLDGTKLGNSSGKDGAALRDLALPAGVYTVRVARSNLEAFPFRLVAAAEASTFDPEPNDSVATAVDIADGEQVVGRLARVSNDDDLYRLTVPSGQAMLRDITLASDGDVKRSRPGSKGRADRRR